MARAYRFTIIRLPASSLEDAHEIVGRLAAIGLPRQSMDVAPHEDSYHVAVRTPESNRKRIMRAAEGLTSASMSKPVMAGAALGGAALLGAALWGLWRNKDRVQELLGQGQEHVRASLRVGDQDRATLASARGDRSMTDRSGTSERTSQAFGPGEGSTIGGGGHTAAPQPGQSGLGSGQYTSREQSASNIGAHTGGFTGGGTAGQAGAPKQPTDTEPRDAAARAGTEGSVDAIG